MADGEAYRELGEAAWSWVLGEVRGDDGPWLPETVPPDGSAPGPAADRDCLYAGIAGLAPVLAEIARYRRLTDAERALADGIVARLGAQAATRTEASLYDGLAGYATALRLLAPGSRGVALRRLDELMTPAGWESTVDLGAGSAAPLTDLVMGTAGIVLTAAWAGGEHAAAIMTTGGEALLRAAEPTEAGLDWRMWPGYPSRAPELLARHRRGGHRAGHRRPRPGPAGLHRGRGRWAPGTCCRSAGSTTAASSSRTPCRTRRGRWSRSPTPGATARPGPR